MTGSVVDYAADVTIGNPLVVNSNTTQLQVTTGTATQAGSISELAGPRPIEKIGAGVLVLTAANTYTGGTTISAGTLQLGNGGASGSIAGEVINNGVLAINRSDTYAFNGVISGTGALVQNGTGATILTTTNTYSGTTTINAGTLIVDGSIANSAVIVNNGALLTGNGAVGPTTINGALLPGQSIGTITVNGDLTFGAVGVYLVEVSPASADRTNVIGTAALNGTVLAIFAPGSYITRQYTILHADGGLGGTRFTNLNSSNLPASLSANLSYTSSDVILNLTANLGEAIGTAGLSRNQQNVASGLDTYFNNGGTMPPSFSGLFGLTGTNLGTALTLLSGEAATGAQQVGLVMTGQFLGLMLDPFVDGRSGATGADGPALGFAPETGTQPERLTVAYPSAFQAAGNKAATFEQRIGPWGAAYGGTSRTAGDPIGIGSHDLSARSAGIVGGLDLRLTPDAVMGVALAGGAAQWSLAQGLGGGQSDAFQAGIYGATRSGAAYLSGALAYTNHWMSTDRVALGGDHLTAKFNAQGFGARIEGGYRLGTAFGAFTPYAALQAQRLGTPNYAETDLTNGGYALGYLAHTGTGTRSELGGHFDRVLALRADAALALRARLAWAHDSVSDPTLVAEFQSLPGAGFMVTGAVPVKDSLLVSAGSELRLANGLSLIGKFEGEFADRLQAYGGTGTVRYAW
jgi:outer membrane autotransporter protein